MFVAQEDGYWGGGTPDDNSPALAPAEAVLLWSLRRLAPAIATAGPMARCRVVEVTLIRQFGGRGQEIGVLLRCLAQLLVAGAVRPLQLGCPAMAALTADETMLLHTLRSPEATPKSPLDDLLHPLRIPTATRLLAMIATISRTGA
ncbi:hypothetical protein FHS79_002749 [Polymorphobacter multimanifer]|uniref:Uncharacterized protein n=1 Tax=Polymorphobacter multimanifer TaxID=1070431 RepID=A0A841L6H4_9SPHN|nr:hypothetical protein [Polymorphobacter multimanifer]MBB6228559.1 hypothetical protein [Polymorphobacter multimanifer]